MKKSITTSIITALAVIGSTVMAQDQPAEYLGLPGDNLNLYAVMNLFQQSETLEGFERNLNDENNRINNLDLNGDNLTDYLKVVDYVDGNVHTIVLQALLGRNETQDVAVFTVERLRDGSVQIQLTGDEMLYGRNYIIEPIYAETPNPGYTGADRRNNTTVVRTTYVEVAAWPVIRFMFLPDYVIWRSSWYWGYYPHYWNPWRPFYWHYYYGYHYHWYPDYYRHYHRFDHHRYARWDDFYYHGNRTYSHNVNTRIKDGDYRTTYSHPEQRRDGEALYAKVHPERQATSTSGQNVSRRSSGGNTQEGRQSSGTVNSTSRRSGSTVTGNDRTGKTTTGSESTTSRRSTTTVTERKGNPASGQSTGTTRRSATTSTERKENTPSAGQASGETRRPSGPTATERKESNPSSGQAAGTSRRSTTTVTERTTVHRPESAPRTETVRTSRQSATTVSSSERRSGGTSRVESKQNTAKSSKENSTSSRRK